MARATSPSPPPRGPKMEVASPPPPPSTEAPQTVLAAPAPAPAPAADEEPSKETEVATISPEFLLKHPLQNVWTIWYFEPVKGDWRSGQKEITSVSTVEDFWSIYNHIKLASELKPGCDYSLFKHGITPMWEDPKNSSGGKWLLILDKRHRTSDLDRIWLDVCLALIGEALKYIDEVCGSIVNVRQKQDKISLWIGDHSKNVMEIGKDFKEKLKLTRIQIQYITHKDQMKAGSTTKYTYTI